MPRKALDNAWTVQKKPWITRHRAGYEERAVRGFPGRRSTGSELVWSLPVELLTAVQADS